MNSHAERRARELIDQAHSGQLDGPGTDFAKLVWIGQATAIMEQLLWDVSAPAVSARLTDA